VKTVKRWKYLRDYFQEETKKVAKPISRAAGQEILKRLRGSITTKCCFLKICWIQRNEEAVCMTVQ
jgi:hypothetical protein